MCILLCPAPATARVAGATGMLGFRGCKICGRCSRCSRVAVLKDAAGHQQPPHCRRSCATTPHASSSILANATVRGRAPAPRAVSAHGPVLPCGSKRLVYMISHDRCVSSDPTEPSWLLLLSSCSPPELRASEKRNGRQKSRVAHEPRRCRRRRLTAARAIHRCPRGHGRCTRRTANWVVR